MHIRVEAIFLSKLEFEVLDENLENLSYELGVQCDSHVSEEGDFLIQHVTFNLGHEIEKPPFKFEFVFTAYFRAEGEGSPSLEEFSQVHAPAYIVPYARELIANMTSRSKIPTLIIPPVNVFTLISKGLHEDELSKNDAESEL